MSEIKPKKTVHCHHCNVTVSDTNIGHHNKTKAHHMNIMKGFIETTKALEKIMPNKKPKKEESDEDDLKDLIKKVNKQGEQIQLLTDTLRDILDSINES